MAENSYFFTAVSGSPAYSATDFCTWLYNALGRPDGVVRGEDNALAVTTDGAGNAIIATGVAYKSGHGYQNTASLTKALNLPASGYKQYSTIVIRVDSSTSPNTMHAVVLAGTSVLIANTATPPSITSGTDVYIADVLVTNTSGTYSYAVTDQRIYAPIAAPSGANWYTALTTALGGNWSNAMAEALSQAHVPSSSAALPIASSWNTPLTTALGSNWPTALAKDSYLGDLFTQNYASASATAGWVQVASGAAWNSSALLIIETNGSNGESTTIASISRSTTDGDINILSMGGASTNPPSQIRLSFTSGSTSDGHVDIYIPTNCTVTVRVLGKSLSANISSSATALGVLVVRYLVINGGPLNPKTSSDPNAIYQTGFYQVTTNSNNPTSDITYMIIANHHSDSLYYGSQIAIGQSSSPSCYYRYHLGSSTGWTAWTRVATGANALPLQQDSTSSAAGYFNALALDANSPFTAPSGGTWGVLWLAIPGAISGTAQTLAGGSSITRTSASVYFYWRISV